MPSPTKYTRQYDYTSYQTANPNRPLPADKVNADLNQVALSTKEIVDFLKTSLRADGKIMNGAIGREQLNSSVGLGFTPPTEWATSTIYTANVSTVFYSDAFYSALVSHTSSGTFDPTKWALIADFASLGEIAISQDPNLSAISTLIGAADKGIVFTGPGATTTFDLSPFARTLLDDTSASAMLTTLGVSAYAKTLIDDADAAAARTTLGLAIGDDVQAYDADLGAIAALTTTGILRRTGANTWTLGTSVANSELAVAPAYTIKGNSTGSSAVPTDIDINALTLKATPASGDVLLLLDSAAGFVLKKTTAGGFSGGGGAAVQPPGGRLTLQSGSPVMTSDQVASQNLYYAPDRGNLAPVRVSGSWANQAITSSSTDQVGLTLALAGSANWAVDTLHDVFLIVDGGVPKLATRLWDAGMYPTETLITPSTTLASGGAAGYITTGTGANAWARPSAAFDGTTVQPIATAARIPPPSNNGLSNALGQDWGTGNTKTVSKVVVTAASDNNLQGSVGLSVPVLIEGSNDGTNWIRLSFHYLDVTAYGTTYSLPVNEYYQTPYRMHRLNITGDATAGGGVGYSINVAEVQCFQKNAPANGRRLTKYDGLLVNDAAMTARINATTTVSVAQYEGTFLGTIQIDPSAAGQVTAHVSSGPSRLYGVYNAYNQRTLGLQAYVPLPNASNYALTAVRWTPIQNTAAWSARFVKGLADEDVTATLNRNVYINAQTPGTSGGVYSAGIAVDNTAIFSGNEFTYVLDSTGQAMGSCGQAKATLRPFAGSKLLTGIEKKDERTGSVVSPGADARSGSLEVTWRG